MRYSCAPGSHRKQNSFTCHFNTCKIISFVALRREKIEPTVEFGSGISRRFMSKWDTWYDFQPMKFFTEVKSIIVKIFQLYVTNEGILFSLANKIFKNTKFCLEHFFCCDSYNSEKFEICWKFFLPKLSKKN